MENKYKQMWEELEKKLATILTANEMIDAFLQEQHGIGEYHAYTRGQQNMQDRYENLTKEIKEKHLPKRKER
jgi:SAM-dependent MidA family methyltransferase